MLSERRDMSLAKLPSAPCTSFNHFALAPNALLGVIQCLEPTLRNTCFNQES